MAYTRYYIYAIVLCFLLALSPPTVSSNEVDASWSTYLGGSNDDFIPSIPGLAKIQMAYDSGRNLVIVGRTMSDDFPRTDLSYNFTYTSDITLSKFSPEGKMIFSTVFGGEETDWPTGLVIDKQDNIIITGVTSSVDFPTSDDAIQGSFAGGESYNTDGFISIFSSSGELDYSTFLGGSRDDWIYSVDLDSEKEIIITGDSDSIDFPTKNAYMDKPNTGVGEYDVFVSKLSKTEFNFSTYIGGTGGGSAGLSIKVDNQDNIILVGGTFQENFPTSTTIQDTYGGDLDGIIVKFNAKGELIFSTFFGGSGFEQLNDIAISSDDSIYITGTSYSSIFPDNKEPLNGASGSGDVLLMKISSESDLVFYTLLGGTSIDEGWAIDISNNDEIYLTGETQSKLISNTGDLNGSYDAYIAVFTNTGALSYLQYFGGNNVDRARDILCNGNYIALAMYTSSTNLASINSHTPTLQGSYDMYISVLNGADISSEEAALSFTLFVSVVPILVINLILNNKRKIKKSLSLK
jgi:hypothetical protein